VIETQALLKAKHKPREAADKEIRLGADDVLPENQRRRLK
jgi:hypothetical protein